MSNYPTPHIDSSPSEISKTVLMPGDPLRSKFIADNYLDNPVLFNNVRGVQGYTGTYNGKPVSVMASGMGMPSIGIYSYELYNFFGVENIIRIGTAGAIGKDVKVRDLIFAMSASTDSNFAVQYGLPGTYAPTADFSLLSSSISAAEKKCIEYKVGNVLSTDIFYHNDSSAAKKWAQMGVLAIEMETAALYMNAARAGKRALGMFTVSDEIFTGKELTAAERQTTLDQMITVALETATK